MGCVPTTSKIGSIKFDDFLEYAHKNWNFYDSSRSAPFMQMADTLISKAPQEWSPDDVERILEMFEKFDAEGMMHTYALHGYYGGFSFLVFTGCSSSFLSPKEKEKNGGAKRATIGRPCGVY